MILPESFVNGSNRNAIVNPAQKWPRGKIPYTIDYSLGNKTWNIGGIHGNV